MLSRFVSIGVITINRLAGLSQGYLNMGWLWISEACRAFQRSSFAPPGLVDLFVCPPHSLRCGLHSFAALRLCLPRGLPAGVYLLMNFSGCYLHFIIRDSLTAEGLQHLGFDVAAGDDGYVQFCFWELIGAEEESGGGDCAARFGYRLRICG